MPESKEVLTSNPEILGGERVFAGTRVRVRNLDLARQALTTGAGSS